MAKAKTAGYAVKQAARLWARTYANYRQKDSGARATLAATQPGLTKTQTNAAIAKSLGPAWKATRSRAYQIAQARSNVLSRINPPIPIEKIQEAAAAGDRYAKAWATRIAKYGPTGVASGKAKKK